MVSHPLKLLLPDSLDLSYKGDLVGYFLPPSQYVVLGSSQ